MPMVVAETLRSCVYMNRNKVASFRCCTQLFTLWIHSHITFEKDLKCDSLYSTEMNHVSKFMDQGRRDWDEEMRVSCNDMEEEKEWAKERLESRKEDCWKLLEGKRRLRDEVEDLTSYLEEYRTQLQDCRRERDDLREKLAKSEGETKAAREEAIKYKRKWVEERKDHRLVAVEIEEKNARLAKREAE